MDDKAEFDMMAGHVRIIANELLTKFFGERCEEFDLDIDGKPVECAEWHRTWKFWYGIGTGCFVFLTGMLLSRAAFRDSH